MELRAKEASARAPQRVRSPALADDKPKQQNDEDEWSDSDSDDAKSYTSNQTEDDDDEDPEGLDETERQENDREDVAPQLAKQPPVLKTELPPLIRPVAKPLPAVLSVPASDANKRGITEPRPPRGSSCSSEKGLASSAPKSDGKRSRHKFQFPDAELLKLVLEDENQRAALSGPRSSSSVASQRRRFSSTAAVMSTTLPLRRKSFSLTKGTGKSSTPPLSAPAALSPVKMTRYHARRKSTSACVAHHSGVGSRSPLSNKNLVSSLPPLPRSASASPLAASAVVSPPTSSTSSSQMVLQVRERKSDGIPELVISKRPSRFLVWQWSDRQVRIPFNIQLGPHQHGVMLRQLRYVKSVMNDFPWAKTHLKDLLAAYTKKDMTKEDLYPQLNQLSSQVQFEINAQVKKQKQIVIKKQRLTMQLSLATNVINETQVTKYGRLGKPHCTRLYYDPGQPTKLHWIRKNGDRSSESLEVDTIEIHCYDADSKESELSAGMKKAVKKFSQTATLDSCLSLVTPLRTLDLQLKSGLHREWLMNALCDVISFARQYRAAGARRDNNATHNTHVLRRM